MIKYWVILPPSISLHRLNLQPRDQGAPMAHRLFLKSPRKGLMRKRLFVSPSKSLLNAAKISISRCGIECLRRSLEQSLVIARSVSVPNSFPRLDSYRCVSTKVWQPNFKTQPPMHQNSIGATLHFRFQFSMAYISRQGGCKRPGKSSDLSTSSPLLSPPPIRCLD